MSGFIKFDALLRHTETLEDIEVTVEGLWQPADPSVGIERGYLIDIEVMSIDDDEELDMDDYGGEEVIQDLAVEYWEEEL
tara:strand:- start:284 stop:523 length:240 start_codon:yes stop_codon:yes gene_type:complete